MTSSALVFQIKLKKITFKQPPIQEHGIMFNLLFNNKKIDNTEHFQVPGNQKAVDLSSIKSLIFDSKEDTSKLPIFIYILYGEVSAKKIILKRADMMKRYELEQKKQFNFEEDFGVFMIGYQVTIKKETLKKDQTQKQNELQQSQGSKSLIKNDQSPFRNFKRPSMLQVGQKAERIRKSSADQRQLAESQVRIQESESIIKSQKTDMKQSTNVLIPALTIVKDQKEDQKVLKKELKINLFQNFTSHTKNTQNPQNHTNETERVHTSNHHSVHVSHRGSGQIAGSHHGHSQVHKSSHSHHSHNEHGDHEDHGEHNNGHDSHGQHHDEHEESGPLSLKLKTVIAMLIIGFLFLMYDALDDRFSRKVRKISNLHDHTSVQHGQSHESISHHQSEGKKKKTTKKSKKVSTH